MDADSANSNQRAVTPAPRWARILWFAFSLTALVATGIWAERVATGRSVDEQRALVPVSTVTRARCSSTDRPVATRSAQIPVATSAVKENANHKIRAQRGAGVTAR